MVEKESGNFQAYQGTLTFVMTGLNAMSSILWVLQFKSWLMMIYLHTPVPWNFSFWTPLFKGHLHPGDTKFCPGKTFTQSLFEGTVPLFRGKRTFFLVLKPWFTCTCNFQSGDTLAIKLWLNTNLPISLSVR